MTQRDQLYKCEICGNLIKVVHGAGGTLVCCFDEMRLQEPNTADVFQDSHVPVVEKNGKTLKVSVGIVPHPMEEGHFIESISILMDKRLYEEYLSPGDKPEAIFENDENVRCVRAYCNLHGLWKSE